MIKGKESFGLAVINSAITCGTAYFVLYAIIWCLFLEDKSDEMAFYLYGGTAVVCLLAGVITAVLIKNKPGKEMKKIARRLNFVVFLREAKRKIKRELFSNEDDD